MLNMKQKVVLVVLVSTLTAVLAAGLIRATVTYDVEMVLSPSGPVVYAPARRPFNISCQMLGGDASNVSAMKWLGPKGNDIGEGNPGIVKSENNLLYLTFTDPKSEDRGIYKCAAKYGKNYNLQYAVNIVFYGPAPEFDLDYENRTYTEGDRVELQCFARGETPMTYEWYDQSNNLIEGNWNISILKSSNESLLVIDNVQLSHEGMYSCNAKNTHGLSSKLFDVIVTPRSVENDTSLVRLDVAVVKVTATSVQFAINVTGSGDYIEVRYTEKMEKEERTLKIALRPDKLYSIDNLIPGGLYTFEFRLGGNSEWVTNYTVKLLPEAPELIVRRQENGILEFEWFRKFDDLVRGTIDKYEISYYSLSMRRGNEWVPSDCVVTIQVPSCRGSSYIIAGLQPKVYYQIEVRAHTDAGYGQPSMQKIYMSS